MKLFCHLFSLFSAIFLFFLGNSSQTAVPESDGSSELTVSTIPDLVASSQVEPGMTHPKQLAKWGFEYFQTALEYHTNKKMKCDPEKLVNDHEFVVISDVMNETKDNYDTDDVLCAFHCIDKYGATGLALQKIYKFGLIFASNPNNDIQDLISEAVISEELKAQIFFENLVLRCKENQLKLDGSNINSSNKKFNMEMLPILSKEYSSLSIKNLPLDLKDYKIIQSLLTSHITSFYLDNCPFIFSVESEFYFDFSRMHQLTHFQIFSCLCRNLMLMLKTIKSSSLIYLDVSCNYIPIEKQTDLISFIMSFESLEFLGVKIENHEFSEFPQITGEILKLKNLKVLNVGRNLDIQSFVNSLAESEPLKLENIRMLNLENAEICEKFIGNFDKLPHLRHLGISKICNSAFAKLSEDILKLESLEKIVFPYPISDDNIELLSTKLQKGKAAIGSTFDFFHPSNWKQIEFLQSFCFEKLPNNFFLHVPSDLNVTAASRMAVKMSEFKSSDHDIKIIFFKAFRNLKTLKIEFDEEIVDWEILSVLFEGNEIDDFSIILCHPFKNYEQLSISLNDKKLKKLALTEKYSDFESTSQLISAISRNLF